MKFAATYCTACLFFICCISATGQGTPPPMPSPSYMRPSYSDHRTHTVVIGTTDSRETPKKVRGKINIIAMPPTSAKFTSVNIFVDDSLAGQKTQAPYKIDYDASLLTDGIHAIKAIALDNNGKQVWTAITKVEAMKEIPVSTPTKKSPNANIQSPQNIAPVTSIHTQAPSFAAVPKAIALTNIYSSVKYGFTVRYPEGWTSKDKTTTMKPKKSGNVWIEFSSGATKNQSLVVNVKRVKLAQNTDADTFAKFNPYVGNWERKLVLGSRSFATTSVDTVSKNTTHRLIVIKSGYAWMLNCIDASGNQSEIGKNLFDSIINSIIINDSETGSEVSVKEIIKKR